DHVVRRALTPLVRSAEPEAILELRIVDPAMGSGAFLVAACRFLASAYEQALVTSGRCHATDIDERDRIGFRRRVAERCLYGVDVNPMAVQLARLSLWLATLSAEQPLSFLDHRLMTGDSLTGAWLSSLRYPPSGRVAPAAALPLFADEAAADALSAALPVRFSLELAPNDTLEQVRRKERDLEALGDPTSGLARWKEAADLWCACWFSDLLRRLPPAAYHALTDIVLGLPSALRDHHADAYLQEARSIAA